MADRPTTVILPVVTVTLVFADLPTTSKAVASESSANDSVPLPSVFKTCPFVPSDVGRVYALFTLTVPVVFTPEAVVSNLRELS